MTEQQLAQAIEDRITINNTEYYTVSTFAQITKRAEDTVRGLISRGTRIRKLKSLKMGRSLFIPVSELVEYQFCLAGRSKLVVRYTGKGEEYTEIIN